MNAYKNQCQSVYRAPFPMGGKDMADHQCSGERGEHKVSQSHYCGCGYEWTDVMAAESTKNAKG